MNTNWELCEGKPKIHLLMVNDKGKSWCNLDQTKEVSKRFITAALLIVLENGQFGPVCQELLRQLCDYNQLRTPFNVSYEMKAQSLCNNLRKLHEQATECNCQQLIRDLVPMDPLVATQEDYYTLTERLRTDLDRDFVCEGLCEDLISLIPYEPEYGSEYDRRLREIQPVDDSLVAYEYFDTDEEEWKISCLCSSNFPDFPAFDVAHAILENDLSMAAADSLAEMQPECSEFIRSLF